MRVLIAAGGTAGHINPGLAIADIVKQNGGTVMFVGTPNGMEADQIPQAGYGFFAIPMSGISRRLSPRGIVHNLRSVKNLITASRKAKDAIRKFKPDVVVGTGSYITYPVIRAAKQLGVKTALHESNSYPGIAIRFAARFADKIFLADETAALHLRAAGKAGRCITVGMPMRATEVLTREQARAKLSLNDNFTILSCGGSLGATRINAAVRELLTWEGGHGINHIHGYGKNGASAFTPEDIRESDGTRRIVKEYITDMYDCIAAADLVICRSGAATQAELKMFGRGSVQIPYPYAADNHQYKNARSMAKQGACVIISDKDLTGERLIDTVARLKSQHGDIARMGTAAGLMYKPNASEKIYALLQALHA